MKITRTGSAHWQGGIKDGKGAISTQSGSLKAYPYGFAITAVHLVLEARIPGADADTFASVAAKAKAGCPVSKLFNATITLETRLVG